MKLLPQVVLVGRPNVGKSRLFNRLVGRRLAIVHDMPGVTRDIQSAEVGGKIQLLDTGGLGLKAEPTLREIVAASELQVEFTVEMADLVLFVVDGKEGMTGHDEEIADRLRRSGKPVFVLVNKSDVHGHEQNLSDFYRLGFKETLPVSAEHGLGMDPLWDAIDQWLESRAPAEEPEAESFRDASFEEEEERIKICFIGKPNVGKSSLSNAILRTDRMIVSPVPGTTRDTIRQDFDLPRSKGEPWKFTLLDTAGMRASTKIGSSVDYFSMVRSTEAMREADVVFLVVDAREGPGKIEKLVGGKAVEAGKAIVVIVNKWDYVKDLYQRGESVEGYDDEPAFREAFEESLKQELFFLPESPILFVSATEQFQLTRVLKAAREVNRRQHTRIGTGSLNTNLKRWTVQRSPRYLKGKAFKIFYAVQVGTHPIRLKLFCNRAGKMEDSYRKFLSNKLISEYDLGGCPIQFDLVGKEVRYSEEGRHRRSDTVLPSKKPGEYRPSPKSRAR